MAKRKEEVMTAEEIAEYLRIHPYTVRRLARAGKLPGFKVGGQWRFNRNQIGDLANTPAEKREIKSK